MELSKIQEEIVKTNNNKVVVIASAATGKTRIITERIKYLLDNGAEPTRIVAITFTNAAAEEISERLDHPKGVFIGTIHGYANQLLLRSGIDTSKILLNEEFDRLFTEIKKYPECIRAVDYLLLDESQDSDKNQFDFLLNMVRPKNYMLVGDHRQSIYQFRGARPDILIDLIHNPEVATYNLNENYRCGRSILRYAKGIIHFNGVDYDDYSIPMRDTEGQVIEVNYSKSALAKSIKKLGNYKDWFILTRTNDQLEEMVNELKTQGIPCDTFKRAQLDNTELNKKMKEDTVKVLTIHTSKGLEAKYVIVIGAKFYNIDERCVSYVAATRARDLLVWTSKRQKGKSRKLTTDNWE